MIIKTKKSFLVCALTANHENTLSDTQFVLMQCAHVLTQSILVN